MSAPFGIEFHSSLSTLRVIEPLSGRRYVVEAPTPHPLLPTYLVQTNAADEVVWIKGLGPVIENDAYGVALRASADRVAEQLAQKYGKGQHTDHLAYGSIWGDGPQHWMQALSANERHYFYVWERPFCARLPDDIANIFVGAVALSPYESNVVIEYSSPRLAVAEADDDQDMASIL